MNGGKLKNVCLSVTSLSPIIFWSIGPIEIKKFYTN